MILVIDKKDPRFSQPPPPPYTIILRTCFCFDKLWLWASTLNPKPTDQSQEICDDVSKGCQNVLGSTKIITLYAPPTRFLKYKNPEYLYTYVVGISTYKICEGLERFSVLGDVGALHGRHGSGLSVGSFLHSCPTCMSLRQACFGTLTGLGDTHRKPYIHKPRNP